MPVSIESPSVTLISTQPARFSILTLQLAGGEPINMGILLEDPANDRNSV